MAKNEIMQNVRDAAEAGDSAFALEDLLLTAQMNYFPEVDSDNDHGLGEQHYEEIYFDERDAINEVMQCEEDDWASEFSGLDTWEYVREGCLRILANNFDQTKSRFYNITDYRLQIKDQQINVLRSSC